MSKKNLSFFIVWVLIVAVVPMTILKATPFASVSGNKILLINFLQRLIALLAFSLLFVQVVLGSYMQYLKNKFGSWIFKFHLYQGMVVYSLVLLHPLLFVLYRFRSVGTLDPFYVFSDFCILCKPKIELFYTLGRVAFVFLTLAVLAAKLKNHPLMEKNWRKVHVLNYLVFILVAIHLRFVGSDALLTPFVYFYWLALATVVLIVCKKVLPSWQKGLRKVLDSS